MNKPNIITVRGIFKNNTIITSKDIIERVNPYGIFYDQYKGEEAYFNLKRADYRNGWTIIQYIVV